MSERSRATVFGEVAELYDSARPSYPDELVDDVLAYAGAGPGDRALEVGSGTGKASVLFAARGLDLLCLEPSAPMAEVWRRAAAALPNVSIEEIGFEGWRFSGPPFQLLFSAQAWHWVAPEVRYVKAHEVLAPGGALALFWNRDDTAPGPLRDELDRVYEAHASGTPALGPSGQIDRLREIDEVHLGEVTTSELFKDATARDYSWAQTYPTDRYLQLLTTRSDHRLVDENVRTSLLAAVGEAIDAAGGEITLQYETRLYLARPA